LPFPNLPPPSRAETLPGDEQLTNWTVRGFSRLTIDLLDSGLIFAGKKAVPSL